MDQAHTQPASIPGFGLPASALGLGTLHESVRPKAPPVSLGDIQPGQNTARRSAPPPVSLGDIQPGQNTARRSAPPPVSLGDPAALTSTAIVDTSGVVDSTLSERGAQLAQQQARQPAARSLDDVNAELQMAASDNDDGVAASEAAAHQANEQALEKLNAEASDPPGQLFSADTDSSASALGGEQHQAAQHQANEQIRQQLDAMPTAQPGAAPADGKKRRAPLPIVDRVKVMQMVETADPKMPDAQLAAAISISLGKAVASSTVSSYRQQLGMASVKMPTRSELAARLAEVEARLAKATQLNLATAG